MASFKRSDLRNIMPDITDEQESAIIKLHRDVLDGVKKERDEAESKVAELEAVQKELDGLKKSGGNWEEKYQSLKKEYEGYKAEIESKAAHEAKRDAVKAYFESKGISGKNLEIAMRGAADEIKAVELEDGKIKDDKDLDAMVSGVYASLVSSQYQTGVNTKNPISGSGKLSKAEIMKIKDPVARQKAIAENMEAFNRKE